MEDVQKIVRFISQWKVIIPLGCILLVVLAWPQKSEKLAANQTAGSKEKTTSLISYFNTNKKLSCNFASASATIDNNRLSASYPQSDALRHVIFDGDCLYRWADGALSGERSCGLSQYLPLLSNFASNQAIEKIFPAAQDLADSCKDISVVSQSTFEVPKKVLFKNKKLL